MKQIILLYVSLFAFSTFGQSAARVLINTTTPSDTANRTVQVDVNGNFKVVNTWDYINGVNWMMNTSKMNNDAGFITSANAPVQSVNGQTGAVNVFDGNYNNLTNKPTLFSGAYNDLTGKPTLFSGSYTDLTNKPTIPAQVNISQGTGITVSGSYPNITVSNSAPDQTVTLSNGTGINVTGTYPSFTVNSTVTAGLQVYSKTSLLGTGVAIVDTFTISSATPTVSFTSILATTGKSNFKIISATGFRASATAVNSPNVSVTALTSNSATFILTQQNTATITILGINVLSGLPMILVPDPANVKLVLSLIAY